jgi:hypothetical protein
VYSALGDSRFEATSPEIFLKKSADPRLNLRIRVQSEGFRPSYEIPHLTRIRAGPIRNRSESRMFWPRPIGSINEQVATAGLCPRAEYQATLEHETRQAETSR